MGVGEDVAVDAEAKLCGEEMEPDFGRLGFARADWRIAVHFTRLDVKHCRSVVHDHGEEIEYHNCKAT